MHGGFPWRHSRSRSTAPSAHGRCRPDDAAVVGPARPLGLTGTKFGCGIAQCGACTVFLDGKPLRSCVTPVSAVGSGEITTIEGVSGHAKPSRAERLGRARRAAMRLLPVGPGDERGRAAARDPKPTDHDIDLAMNGNICRCATYVRIRAAIQDAARTLEG